MRDLELDGGCQYRQQPAARRGQPDKTVFATAVGDVVFTGFPGAVDDLALEHLQVAADQMPDAAVIVCRDDESGQQMMDGFVFRTSRRPFDYIQHGLHARSEEHTSELQSPDHLVCRLLLEKKKKQ